jgi:hypothetical protein
VASNPLELPLPEVPASSTPLLELPLPELLPASSAPLELALLELVELPLPDPLPLELLLLELLLLLLLLLEIVGQTPASQPAQGSELPHWHAPDKQLSDIVGSHEVQLPPSDPQAAIDGDAHPPVAQHPVAQEVESQTQPPPTQ